MAWLEACRQSKMGSPREFAGVPIGGDLSVLSSLGLIRPRAILPGKATTSKSAEGLGLCDLSRTGNGKGGQETDGRRNHHDGPNVGPRAYEFPSGQDPGRMEREVFSWRRRRA